MSTYTKEMLRDRTKEKIKLLFLFNELKQSIHYFIFWNSVTSFTWIFYQTKKKKNQKQKRPFFGSGGIFLNFQWSTWNYWWRYDYILILLLNLMKSIITLSKIAQENYFYHRCFILFTEKHISHCSNCLT